MAKLSDPRSDPTSIGNLLKPYGVTPQDVDRALDFMQSSDLMLGESLVRLGVIDYLALEVVLAHQKVLRGTKGSGQETAENVGRVLDLVTERTRRRGRAVEEVTHKTGEVLSALIK